MTIRSVFCGGSTVAELLRPGPRGQLAEVFSTIGRTSSALTVPYQCHYHVRRNIIVAVEVLGIGRRKRFQVRRPTHHRLPVGMCQIGRGRELLKPSEGLALLQAALLMHYSRPRMRNRHPG
jgi:hypothetical protein